MAFPLLLPQQLLLGDLMKPNERGVGAKVMVYFGRTTTKNGTLVPATIVGVTPKRVKIQRDNEKEIFIKKWSEIC